MVNIHSLAVHQILGHIDQHYVANNFLNSKGLGGCCADHTAAANDKYTSLAHKTTFFFIA
jgi:hypothetical protein